MPPAKCALQGDGATVLVAASQACKRRHATAGIVSSSGRCFLPPRSSSSPDDCQRPWVQPLTTARAPHESRRPVENQMSACCQGVCTQPGRLSRKLSRGMSVSTQHKRTSGDGGTWQGMLASAACAGGHIPDELRQEEPVPCAAEVDILVFHRVTLKEVCCSRCPGLDGFWVGATVRLIAG